MSIEAMKQALNALEPYARQIVDQGKDYEMVKCDPKVDTAITALRTAIAEADKHEAWEPSDTSYRPGGLPQDFIAEAEKQEPVGTVKDLLTSAAWERLDVVGSTKVYLGALPAAQRQPLTDEQIDAVCAPLGFAQLSPREVARAIEAAHGIGGKA